MPELPEVETTRRGIEPHLVGRAVTAVVVRQPSLRWPVAAELRNRLVGAVLTAVRRRAKYLLLDSEVGSALVHLGMSGSLRILPGATPPGVHDHVDLHLADGRMLRFTDPRRFGCWLWQAPGDTHPLLRGMGPEPLDDAFDGEHVWRLSRGRAVAVKTFLMDQAVVVGVGNIYAAESLFRAGIHPARAAGRIARARYARLAEAVKAVLAHAIDRGGTTLRDFLNADGAPGYFEQELMVYGREGEPCRACATILRGLRLGQRASAYCPRCQR
ncbi:MAG TPA: bifunctional DNA-formamidopyrimidine glycosylase/DNA-(apurinic or apyrimidinic site) lyase [Xanthomonadaceae bacterium]|nr:bifunctional DNA-formamidopyrimidine glycosylase/DNA-(apurinic or apyrimidinic site) lyase [Xanthomonadaceae bacterium]